MWLICYQSDCTLFKVGRITLLRYAMCLLPMGSSRRIHVAWRMQWSFLHYCLLWCAPIIPPWSRGHTRREVCNCNSRHSFTNRRFPHIDSVDFNLKDFSQYDNSCKRKRTPPPRLIRCGSEHRGSGTRIRMIVQI